MTITQSNNFDDLKKALKNYFAIVEKKKEARFLRNKNLDKKIEQAYSMLNKCWFCERKCGADRLNQKGYCQLTNEMLISSYFDHYGEESFFVPSFTIFFWSCNFRCVFCQNWTISQRYEKPHQLKPRQLAKIIYQHRYCKNINFVGGEPTLQLPFILETLKHVKVIKVNMPVIWNSNFYMSKKSMKLLSGVVDVYLSDFKYGNDECAKELSDIENYTEIVKRNHEIAVKDAEVVVRHLVLPNHVECCSKPILEWIAKKFGKRVVINIMDQYRPEFLVLRDERYKAINRRITDREFSEVLNYAKQLDLNFIF